MNTDPKPVPVLPMSAPESGEIETGLQDYVATLFESGWLILTVVALALVGGLGYALVATPIFRSDASVQVEEKGEGKATGLQELTDMFSVKAAADTEIEILRSRSLLGSVVEKLRLDTVAVPSTFPLLGRAWVRRHDKGQPQPPVLGLSRYAWGGERVQVSRLEVPRDLLGENLWLIALEGERYEVRDIDGDLLATGAVGQAATGLSGQLSLYVSELRARPGTRFRLVKLPVVEAIQRLQKDLIIAEKGKKTGVIRLELSGPDPGHASCVAGISWHDRFYPQTTLVRAMIALLSSLFISAQTPEQRRKLEEAEKAFNAYQSKHGSIDVTLETSALIDRAAEIEKAVSELQLQKAELRQRFTENHHLVSGLNDRAAKLEKQREALEGRIRKLPDTELASVRLMRDVRVANELYVLLLNKAQELRVVKSGTIGNVRVLDRAMVPLKPVRPDLKQVVPLSLALGVFLGIAAAFVKKSLSRGVEDPDELEPLTGIGVYATIPHSRAQVDISRAMAKHKTIEHGVLAASQPEDLAIESVRSLRSSLQFALVDARNNVIALGGPSPGIGKSFVSVNLAQVVADSGKRVLVIDGDVRKGRLHRYFGMSERSPGLSEVIAGSAPLDGCIRPVGPNLDLLATGAFPPNPSELLLSPRFTALIGQVSKQYDLVFIDTPPCLAVTDASIIGRLAGVFLLVLHAGRHPPREILQAIKRLGQSGVRPQGLIFNDVVHLQRRYGYGYAYAYQYAYKRDKKAS